MTISWMQFTYIKPEVLLSKFSKLFHTDMSWTDKMWWVVAIRHEPSPVWWLATDQVYWTTLNDSFCASSGTTSWESSVVAQSCCLSSSSAICSFGVTIISSLKNSWLSTKFWFGSFAPWADGNNYFSFAMLAIMDQHWIFRFKLFFGVIQVC